MPGVEEIAALLGYASDDSLTNLREALHSATSAVPGDQSNKPLAWLGDAVVYFAVSENVFSRLRGVSLGELDGERQPLIGKIKLAEIAVNLGFHAFIEPPLSEAVARKQLETMEAAFEGVVGALFLDKGLSAASEFVRRSLALPPLRE